MPDLVTWLEELGSVLTPQGQIRLVVPDRRFTFDFLRAETQIADVLTARRARARMPMCRNVIDHALHIVEVDAHAVWAGLQDPGAQPRVCSPSTAIEMGRQALLDGIYHDVHCWIFTPLSFARLMAELAAMGLLPFKCAQFHDTDPYTLEFAVALQKCSDREEASRSWHAVGRTIAARLDETARDGDAARQREHVEQLATQQAELARQATELDRLVAGLARAEGEREQLKASLDATRASTSWRLTAPLRAVAGIVRKR